MTGGTMTGTMLLLILASVGLGAVAQVLMKLGMTAAAMREALAIGAAAPVVLAVLTSPGVMGGLALYGIATVLWLGVLSRVELSQAFPFVGLSFVLAAVLGYFVFAEAVSAMRVAGIALIVAGVVLVGRG
jgi:drug/metabolite transporter (DMT)-like permease